MADLFDPLSRASGPSRKFVWSRDAKDIRTVDWAYLTVKCRGHPVQIVALGVSNSNNRKKGMIDGYEG
jgi:hypothetical protein